MTSRCQHCSDSWWDKDHLFRVFAVTVLQSRLSYSMVRLYFSPLALEGWKDKHIGRDGVHNVHRTVSLRHTNIDI